MTLTRVTPFVLLASALLFALACGGASGPYAPGAGPSQGGGDGGGNGDGSGNGDGGNGGGGGDGSGVQADYRIVLGELPTVLEPGDFVSVPLVLETVNGFDQPVQVTQADFSGAAGVEIAILNPTLRPGEGTDRTEVEVRVAEDAGPESLNVNLEARSGEFLRRASQRSVVRGIALLPANFVQPNSGFQNVSVIVAGFDEELTVSQEGIPPAIFRGFGGGRNTLPPSMEFTQSVSMVLQMPFTFETSFNYTVTVAGPTVNETIAGSGAFFTGQGLNAGPNPAGYVVDGGNWSSRISAFGFAGPTTLRIVSQPSGVGAFLWNEDNSPELELQELVLPPSSGATQAASLTVVGTASLPEEFEVVLEASDGTDTDTLTVLFVRTTL